ncbi:hypothetical protein [Telmatospirillum sp.]|uniref:hypothetical protein n=1 Tax=Telmatospirillum sp. TaxID=2079197 RepID=UPI0028524C19|nr:hypothetical protein [Telmatospirillum sp.]
MIIRILKQIPACLIRPIWRRIWSRVEERFLLTDQRLASEAAEWQRRLTAEAAEWQRRLAAQDAEWQQRLADLGGRLTAFETRMDQRLADLDDRLTALKTAWDLHLPPSLNAISSIQALAHEQVANKRAIAELRSALPQIGTERR